VTRLLVVAAVVVVAVLVAAVIQRRRPDAPLRTGFSLPEQLDRSDFTRPEAPWLVAVFTSATCATCADVWAKTEVLASDDVAVQELEYVRDRVLHDRYAIDAVPALVVADDRGVVRRSFLGPVSATHLWAALAEVRGDSVPPGCADTG
jgi:DNA-binding transcriptional regulator of glucitol operon